MKHRPIFIIVLLVGLCSIVRGQTSLYWFDDSHENAKASSVKNGTINVDCTALTSGVHTLHYLYQTEQGIQSSTYTKVFFVPGSDAPMATKGEYWFDDDFANRRQLALSSKAVSIKLGDLGAGLHAVHYHALSADGVASAAYTKLFWIEGEAASLCAYHWWVNDLKDSIKNVRMDGTVALHTLSLDVPVVPLRTVNFHFEMTNGKPMVYAKNTLNLVLDGTDGSSRRVEKDYVDYRVSEAVDATLLLPDEPQTVAKPEGLKWFKVEAAKGDSLAFKASCACTMQLFSPVGGELWRASGEGVKKFGGCRADDGATFYLAVHDVTDAKAQDVTVSYLWEAAKPSGDVNGDQTVDVADIATIISVMASAITPDASASGTADVNGDGVVDVADIATVISIMAANARLAGDMEY